MNNNINEVIDFAKLHGVSVPSDFASRIVIFIEMVYKWNEYAGLVSKGDLDHLPLRHIADSLSLVPAVQDILGGDVGLLLDIGSGGGFPIIPLKLALPDLEIVAIDRSERKCGFLDRVRRELILDNIEIIQGSFPDDLGDCRPGVITARAVEKPESLRPLIVNWMPEDCTFLCQSGAPITGLPKGLEIEMLQDEWTNTDYRRGNLYLVRKSG